MFLRRFPVRFRIAPICSDEDKFIPSCIVLL